MKVASFELKAKNCQKVRGLRCLPSLVCKICKKKVTWPIWLSQICFLFVFSYKHTIFQFITCMIKNDIVFFLLLIFQFITCMIKNDIVSFFIINKCFVSLFINVKTVELIQIIFWGQSSHDPRKILQALEKSSKIC